MWISKVDYKFGLEMQIRIVDFKSGLQMWIRKVSYKYGLGMQIRDVDLKRWITNVYWKKALQ